MRQKDDLEFAQLLNRLREGMQIIPEDVDKLKSRIAKKGKLSASAQKLPQLCTTSSSEHNIDVFANVPETLKTSVEAIDSISGEILTNLRTTNLEKVPDDHAKTMGLIKNLHVWVGVQYELCININVKDGMTNRSSCIVQFLNFRVENSFIYSIIWVMCENKQESFGVKNMLIYIMRTFNLTGHLF